VLTRAEMLYELLMDVVDAVAWGVGKVSEAEFRERERQRQRDQGTEGLPLPAGPPVPDAATLPRVALPPQQHGERGQDEETR
jgi:hypothetical protein